MPRSLLTALAVVIFMPLTAQAQSSALQGAWTITEVSVSTPDTSWTEANPQPGLYIFLEPHYSTLIVEGSEPRELFAGDEPTDAEKLAAYTPFIANSGTYEVSGTTLTVRPLVAKVPNAMSDNSFTYTYRVEGDTLRLTLSAAWAPEGGEIRYTLARRR